MLEMPCSKPVPHGWVLSLMAAVVFLFAVAFADGVEDSRGAGSALSFNRDVRPILSDACFQCHGVDSASRKGDLRLDLSHEAYRDRDGKRAVVPGAPERSEVIRKIFSSNPDEQMPPPKHPVRLTEAQKNILRQWIQDGAEYEEHWAFMPPRRPKPPSVNRDDCVQNEIDRFLLKRMEEVGLKPNPEASRATQIRRLCLDLTGLPPSPDEVADFEYDERPDAYERVVDRLLGSKRFGERMAMWWLDGARYADSHGFQADWERYQWPWRDWVIDSFNRNMPFDQFTLEQIAGDLLENPTRDQILATGFHRNHRINTELGSLDEEWLVENAVDRVETTGAVWLGLTLGCARCHDHKYDPITQLEFYQFFAFFYNVPEEGKGPGRQGNFDPVLKLPSEEQSQRLQEIEEQIRVGHEEMDRVGMLLSQDIKAILEISKDKWTQEQKVRIENEADPEAVDAWEAARKEWLATKSERAALEAAIPSAMVMREMNPPRTAHVLFRGQYDQPGEPVEAGLPEAFGGMPAGYPRNRLGLAKWIVSSDNPLTARVLANRLWDLFFGMGLVKSTENLGMQSDWPSHPELLDWLASEVIRLDWDLKAFVKTLVMSGAYRRSENVHESQLRLDPENRYLSRGRRFRIQAEMVRDQALYVAGLLDETVGGPGVYPYQPDGIWNEFNFYGNLRDYQHAKDEGLYRRSLYTIWKRTAAPPAMTLFDMPSREICVVQRSRTNTPLQALALMNDVTYVEASRHLAERMLLCGATEIEEQLAYGFRVATSRWPTRPELEVIVNGYEKRVRYYASHPEEGNRLLNWVESGVNPGLDKAAYAAMTVTAGLLINLDESISR